MSARHCVHPKRTGGLLQHGGMSARHRVHPSCTAAPEQRGGMSAGHCGHPKRTTVSHARDKMYRGQPHNGIAGPAPNPSERKIIFWEAHS